MTENTGPERLASSCQNVAFAFLTVTGYICGSRHVTFSNRCFIKCYGVYNLRCKVRNLVKCKEALLFSVCCDEASPTPEANTTAASVQICPLFITPYQRILVENRAKLNSYGGLLAKQTKWSLEKIYGRYGRTTSPDSSRLFGKTTVLQIKRKIFRLTFVEIISHKAVIRQRNIADTAELVAKENQ